MRNSLSKKKQQPPELTINLSFGADENRDQALDITDPFNEIPMLMSSLGAPIPLEQIPGPARGMKTPAIMEKPQAYEDSDSLDEDESVRSEDFNTLMNQYQNEFRGKNQNYTSRLPKCVNHLLGEANRLYLEKDFVHSIEVIHEEKGDLSRAVDFLFIETQLNYKSDTNSWCKLADRFFKLQSYKNAGYCYGRALKCEKNNIGLLYKKAQCYDKLKDVRGAVKYYEKIHSLVPEQKEVVMKLGKLYAKVEQQHKAVWLMLEFLARSGIGEAGVDFDVANVCCELLLGRKRYRECGVFIEILGLNPQGLESLLNAYKFFGKSSDEEDPEHDIFEKVFGEVQSKPPGHLADEELQILKDELPVEIIVKYSQSLLSFAKSLPEITQANNANSSNRLSTITPKLTSTALDVLSYCEEFDPTEYHDAFIDMVDLYFEFGYLEKSTQLCERLHSASNEADRSEILLRMGFLFGKLGDWKQEMKAYERVLSLNPENKKARFRLSEIYETNGLYQDALRVLRQNPGGPHHHGLGAASTLTAIPNSKEGANFLVGGARTLAKNLPQHAGGEFPTIKETRITQQSNGNKNRSGVPLKPLQGGEVRPASEMLILQKHLSEVSLGIDNEIDVGLSEHSYNEETKEDAEHSEQGSLGKRTESISVGFDDVAREGMITPAPVNTGRKNLKVEGLIKDINNELEFNSKTRRRMVNIVELNEQFFINIQTNIEEMLSQFDLERLLLDFKQCELGLKSGVGHLLDTNCDPKIYASVDFKSIRKALKLELKKDSFKESIYQLLLNESKGRIRSTFQGALADAPEDFKKDLNNLFIFKRKKQNLNPENSRIESWLKESKNKSRVARNLAQKLIAKMKTVPDFIGFSKFVDIVDSSIKILYQQKKYILLSQICEILYKVSKLFAAYPDFQVTFYNFGFLANCRIQNFEKAYIFFRVIGKNLIQEDRQPADSMELEADKSSIHQEAKPEESQNPLARLMQIAEENSRKITVTESSAIKIDKSTAFTGKLLDFLFKDLTAMPQNKEDQSQNQQAVDRPVSKLKEAFKKLYSAYSQSALNLVCFTMINHLFNEFSNSGPSGGAVAGASNTNSSSYHHRLFFQKFQKQFETGKQLRYFVNLISANNYIGSGSTGPAKDCLLDNKDLDSSPLSNFLLGFIILTESTNRNNEQKVETIHRAFEHFEKYKDLSPPSKLPEVYYNLGRALSHLNMPQAALKMFTKNQTIVTERIEETRRLLTAAAEKFGKDIDWKGFDDYQQHLKIQHLYYESAFNQIVWQHKLHNTGLEFEVITSMFKV